MTDTRYHYFSWDSDHDLSGAELRLSFDGGPEAVAAHTTAPANVTGLGAPPTGFTRYWWRLLIGPDGGDLDVPPGLSEPLTINGELQDGAETLTHEWLLSDTTPDELPHLPLDCWPVVVPSRGTEEWAGYSAEVQEAARSLAVQTLRLLTAYQVGGCPVTLRPCRAGCADTTWAAWPVAGSGSTWKPASVAGTWLNVSCGHSVGSCGCQSLDAIPLDPPVGRIDAVWLDGIELSPTDYVTVGNRLYRTDGDRWPLSQDIAAPLTQPGTFGVVYLNAWQVLGDGALAAGVLSLEYARALAPADAGGAACRLPTNVTQVTRAGVTQALNAEKAATGWPTGLTGIREVDVFVSRYNPHALKVAPAVWSPDLPYARR